MLEADGIRSTKMAFLYFVPLIGTWAPSCRTLFLKMAESHATRWCKKSDVSKSKSDPAILFRILFFNHQNNRKVTVIKF